MPEFEGPGPRPGWSPPPLKLSADAPFIGPVGPIISGSQENLDLGIEGWHRGTSLLAQGLVPLLIVAAGQFNPQPVQAQIFKSQRTASVVAAPSTFVSGSQQRYVDSIGQVFASVRAGGTPTAPEWVSASPQADPSQPAAIIFNSQPAAPTAASPVAEFFSIPPESVDLSIEGWHRGTSLLAQGAVPALTGARQDVTDPIQGSVWPPARTQPVASSAVPATIYAAPSDTSQLAAQVWRTATTQPVSGVIPAFTLAAPELVDLGIEGWHRGVSLLAQGGVPQLIAAYSIPDIKQTANIWPSVRTPPAAASGDIVKPIFAAPQYPPYVAAVTWDAATSPQGPGSSAEFRFGSHAVALYAAEARKSRLFGGGQPAPLVSGDLGTFVRAAPQLVDLTLQARIVPAAITQPVQGAVPVMTRGAPQTVDLTQQGWIRSTTPFGSAPLAQGAVPPLVLGGQPQYNTTQIAAQVWSQLKSGAVPPPAPPNLHRLFIDLDTGHLIWRVSG